MLRLSSQPRPSRDDRTTPAQTTTATKLEKPSLTAWPPKSTRSGASGTATAAAMAKAMVSAPRRGEEHLGEQERERAQDQDEEGQERRDVEARRHVSGSRGRGRRPPAAAPRAPGPGRPAAARRRWPAARCR